MIKKLLNILFLVMSLHAWAFADNDAFKQTFAYGGLIGGYGNVDWSSVVAKDVDTEPSNPTSANGAGFLYGVDVGYQFNSHFAVEGEVIEMPTSNLGFAQDIPGVIPKYPNLPLPNLYLAPPNVTDHLTFSAIMFKVMAPFMLPNLSVFADAGPAYQYLSSSINNIGTFAPTFGGGFIYRLADHWQAEASFQYASGTGKSIHDPMIAYVPELYMGTFKIDYIF